MEIITTVSYYGTGSSAITDLLSEYSNIKSLTNYEFRFAHDPDGLSELEYNLVENFNRHNSGHALKRYKKMVDYYGKHFFTKRYETFFNNKWKTLSYEYIDSLTDFSFPGIWQYDFYDKGKLYEFLFKLPDRFLHATIWKNKPDKHLFLIKSTTLASHPTEKKFLEKTQQYTEKLLSEANKENMPYILVDQILPSSNIGRHMRYFKNIKAFVVDRDPRDVYLLAKYVWNDSVVPKDIDIFCLWFEYIRTTKKVEKWDDSKIMFIQFEDLVYNYDSTIRKISDWLGINEKNHLNKKKFFNPEISKNNTRYWIQHPQYSDEAKYIAEKLPEYIYEIGEEK